MEDRKDEVKRKHRGLIAVLLSVFIDILGLSIILPIIPFLALKFKANAQQLGLVYAAFAGSQMIATPITGRLSDKYGRRRLLLLSLTGSMVGFAIQGLAGNLVVFIVGRVVGGLFGGSIPLAQAYIADITTSAQRPRYFAYLGSVMTVGFMFGPGIGAGLSQFTLQTPMWVACGLAAFGLGFAYFNFSEPVKNPPPSATQSPAALERSRGLSGQDEAIDDNSKTTASTSTTAAKSQPERSRVADDEHEANVKDYRLLVWLMWVVAHFFTLGFSAFIYFFGIYIFDQFGYGTLQYGFASMAVSVFGMINQTWTFSPVQKRIGKHAAGVFGQICMSIGLFLMSMYGKDPRAFSGVPLMCISLVFLSTGFSFTPPSVTAVLSRYASATRQGAVLGNSQSLQALARTLGPIVWGSLYSTSKKLPFIIGSVCCLFSAVVMTWVLYLNRRLPEHSLERERERDAQEMEEMGRRDTIIETMSGATPEVADSAVIQVLRDEIDRLRNRLQEYENLNLDWDEEMVEAMTMNP